MPAINKRLALKLILVNRLRKRLKRKERTTSIRPIFFNRVEQGDSVLIRELRDDSHYHHRYFRMSKINFDEILQILRPHITGAGTHARPISPTEKLAITLRYLASGNSQISLSMSYRISPSSISCIVREVLSAISKLLGPVYLSNPTMEDWMRNEEGFRIKWNHPNAVGAMDGKHVRIQAPSLSGSTHYNYKGYFSIVLLAIVDPNYKFSIVDIGASGSQSDGGVFSRSAVGQQLQNGHLKIPAPKKVGNTILPHVIVADDAFALKPNIMKPFPGKFLSVTRRI